MDPVKEAHSVAFAYQPDHVKSCTLKKFFGESAAHTINFGTFPSFFPHHLPSPSPSPYSLPPPHSLLLLLLIFIYFTF
jgi:hypothetical protein